MSSPDVYSTSAICFISTVFTSEWTECAPKWETKVTGWRSGRGSVSGSSPSTSEGKTSATVRTQEKEGTPRIALLQGAVRFRAPRRDPRWGEYRNRPIVPAESGGGRRPSPVVPDVLPHLHLRLVRR